MSVIAAKKRSHIRLSHFDGNDKVVFDMPGGDRFSVTVDEAIVACGAWGKWVEFNQQMTDLRDKLGAWVQARREKVKEAYITVKGNGLLCLVVSNSKSYDDDLESDLTEFDLEVANNDAFKLIRLEVLAIPNSPQECIEAFLASNE